MNCLVEAVEKPHEHFIVAKNAEGLIKLTRVTTIANENINVNAEYKPTDILLWRATNEKINPSMTINA